VGLESQGLLFVAVAVGFRFCVFWAASFEGLGEGLVNMSGTLVWFRVWGLRRTV